MISNANFFALYAVDEVMPTENLVLISLTISLLDILLFDFNLSSNCFATLVTLAFLLFKTLAH